MKPARLMIFVAVLFGIFVVRFWISVTDLPTVNAVIQLRGALRNDLEVYGKSYKYILNHIEVVSKNKPKTLSIGDEIFIRGRVDVAEGMWGFDKKIVMTDEILIIREYETQPLIQKLLGNPWAYIHEKLNSFQEELVAKFKRYYGGKPLALISGMVLGSQELISDEFLIQLKLSGLLHVVVASGGNVAMVSTMIFSAMSNRVGRSLKFSIAYLFIWGYAILTGLATPILRAVVMVGFVWLGNLLGRKTSSIWIVCLTGLVLLIVEPMACLSVSFWLSFSATLGIIMFTAKLEDLGKRLLCTLPLFRFFKPMISLAAQTIAAQILVVPLILSVFGVISNYSVVSNILVGLLVGPITIMGLVLLMIPDVVTWFQLLLSWVIIPLLAFFINVVAMFGSDDKSVVAFQLNPVFVVAWWAIVFYAYNRRW